MQKSLGTETAWKEQLMIKNHLILSIERFLIWWVSIRSRSSLAPQVCKVCRQSHPDEYGPANIANESKMPRAEKDWKWFVRFRYGIWSTSQFWECNHQRSSLLKINNKYWGKCEGTFHCSKRFPQEPHNDSHLRYWRKSMQAVSKNLWRKTGKGKNCWKGSH